MQNGVDVSGLTCKTDLVPWHHSDIMWQQSNTPRNPRAHPDPVGQKGWKTESQGQPKFEITAAFISTTLALYICRGIDWFYIQSILLKAHGTTGQNGFANFMLRTLEI
jgi:hypothetical protein